LDVDAGLGAGDSCRDVVIVVECHLLSDGSQRRVVDVTGPDAGAGDVLAVDPVTDPRDVYGGAASEIPFGYV
jgi:hypothetical protein